MQYFNKGAGNNKLAFPITRKQLEALTPNSMVSVRVGRTHGMYPPAALCNDAALEVALQEVEEVLALVEADTYPQAFTDKYYDGAWGEAPKDIPEPLAHAHKVFALDAPLSFDDPKGLASVVRMDHPMDLGRVMADWLFDQGYRPSNLTTNHFDFVQATAGNMGELNKKVTRALDVAFDVKWYYGKPRPEEKAGKNITRYAEGAPGHTSWPAGHGAVAAATMKHFADTWSRFDAKTRTYKSMTTAVLKQLYDAAYVWAMARTFAGVHYGVDNIPFFPNRAEFA